MPEGIEAIVNPVSSTDCEWLARMAMGSMMTAHATVASRASFTEAAALRFSERARSRSTTVVEESAFRAALKFAMAAARMAAIVRPATPTGRLFQMNSG